MRALFKWLVGSRRVRFSFLIFIAVYIGIYAVLSSGGHYVDNVTSEEKIGIFCLCASDRDEWQPKAVIVTGDSDSHFSLFANPSGYFFMPLVYVDRLWIHHTKSIKLERPNKAKKMTIDEAPNKSLQPTATARSV